MAQGNFGGSYIPPTPNNPYPSVGGLGQASPPNKSKAWIWILGIIGGVCVLGCGCCGVVGYMGFGVASQQLSGMVQQQIKNDPVIQEQIGTPESVTWDVMQLPELQKSHKEIRGQLQAFKVKGPKGEGVVFGAQVDTPTPSRLLQNPILKKDGKEYPLAP